MWNYGMHASAMWLWWLLILVLIVGAVWAVARTAAGGGAPGTGSRSESPETILKQRYARGEIDRDEYERRLSDLRK